MTGLANTLRHEAALDESECFIDATFTSAKGGGEDIGPPNRNMLFIIMEIINRRDLPFVVSTHESNHHEVMLAHPSFDFYIIDAKPDNLIGDRAYDSDKLDEELRGEHKDDRSARK